MTTPTDDGSLAAGADTAELPPVGGPAPVQPADPVEPPDGADQPTTSSGLPIPAATPTVYASSQLVPVGPPALPAVLDLQAEVTAEHLIISADETRGHRPRHRRQSRRRRLAGGAFVAFVALGMLLVATGVLSVASPSELLYGAPPVNPTVTSGRNAGGFGDGPGIGGSASVSASASPSVSAAASHSASPSPARTSASPTPAPTTASPTPTPTPTPPPPPPPPVNRSLGASATSNGALCAPGETAANAIDGTTANNSKWCSQSTTLWLQLDLKAGYQITSFTVRHAGAGGEISGYNTRDFTVQVSNDGSTWSTVWTVTGNTANVSSKTLATPVSARYLRLNVQYGEQSYAYKARIFEFEAWA